MFANVGLWGVLAVVGGGSVWLGCGRAWPGVAEDGWGWSGSAGAGCGWLGGACGASRVAVPGWLG